VVIVVIILWIVGLLALVITAIAWEESGYEMPFVKRVCYKCGKGFTAGNKAHFVGTPIREYMHSRCWQESNSLYLLDQ